MAHRDSQRARLLGVSVDRFLHQLEVIIKPMGEQAVDWFQGACILGEGGVALVVDPDHLEACSSLG